MNELTKRMVYKRRQKMHYVGWIYVEYYLFFLYVILICQTINLLWTLLTTTLRY